jgi:beta-lactamase regulating signal transducer with metallopeptidase domain/5-hydroxyisourate hydrolase-like protein (transthyretin family)
LQPISCGDILPSSLRCSANKPPVDLVQPPSPEIADPVVPSTSTQEAPIVLVSESLFPSWTVGLGLVWCTGFLLLMGRQARLGFCLAKQRRTWRPVADPSLQTLFQACRRELALIRPVKLLLVSEPRTPALVGVFRPCVLLPEALATRFSREELRLILLHELVHVRRWDVLIDRVVTLLACLHWFNPAAWLALVRLRDEREMACDAAVIDLLGEQNAVSYGRVLLKVVEENQRPGLLPGAVGVFGRTLALTRRIHMIAHYQRGTARQAALGLGLLLLLAAFGLTESQSSLRGQDAEVKDKPAALAPAAPVNLAGVCRDEDGKPLKDVHVELYQVDNRKLTTERLKEVVTDGEGRFALPDSPAPRTKDGVNYALIFKADGRASAIYYLGPKALDKMAITLPPAAALRGRVTDTKGKPVADALVWTDGLLRDKPLDGFHSARTDADGRYVIADLPAWDRAKEKPVKGRTEFGGRLLSVRHPNYGEHRQIYQRIPDSIDFVLEPTAVVEGRLIDEVSGKPATKVSVLYSRTDHRVLIASPVFTDEEGKYQLPSLEPGTYNIKATAPPDRVCMAIYDFVVAGGKKYTAPDMKFVEGGWLEGHVVDAESGKPLTKVDAAGGRQLTEYDKIGAKLKIGSSALPRPKSFGLSVSANVDDQGYFRLRVAPGVQFPFIVQYDVWRRTQRREYFEKGVEVKSGEITSVVFRVLPKPPTPDPDPAPIYLKLPVAAERDAAAAVRRLGGWYEVDKDDHVVEVNLVNHKSAEGGYQANNQTDTDEALRVVGDFPRLQKLFLQKGQATDDGLRSLAGLKDLETLMITDAEKVSDAGVKHLAGLTKLNFLHIDHGRIGDESLKVLGQMPGLTNLTLQQNDFTDAGLEHLAKSKQLRSLWLGMNRTTLTDAGLQHLAGLTGLEQLDLQGASIGDRGVAALKDLRELRKLYLGGKGATITDASVEVLLTLTKLEQLTLRKSGLTKDGVKRLMALPNLKALSLNMNALSQQAWEDLEKQKPPTLGFYPSIESKD